MAWVEAVEGRAEQLSYKSASAGDSIQKIRGAMENGKQGTLFS